MFAKVSCCDSRQCLDWRKLLDDRGVLIGPGSIAGTVAIATKNVKQDAVVVEEPASLPRQRIAS